MKWLYRLHHDERGLTAIELAVVAAILVVMAAIVAVNTTGMSSTARSASQLTDIAEVQKAVDRFVAEHPSSYYPIPTPAASIAVSASIDFDSYFVNSDGSTKTLVPSYLSRDPKHADDTTPSWYIMASGVVTNHLAYGLY